MKQQYAKKLLTLQELAKRDGYYLSLLAEYRAMDKAFLRALEEMAPAHRETIMDYMGAVHAINARLLELSLSSSKKS